MKKPYADSYTYDHRKPHVREPRMTKPSMTVPDQNYTMREILNKFTSGQPINDMGVYKDYDYDNPDPKQFEQHLDEYLPHPKTLDLVDRQELKEKLEQKQKTYKNGSKKKQSDEGTPKPSPAGEEK